MAWLIVVVSALFVWGGIQMVRPSPSQRRIANLRQTAIDKGLRIRLGSQLKLDTHQDLSEVVAYVKFRPKPAPMSSGILVRHKLTGQILQRSGCFVRTDKELDTLSEILPPGCTLLAASPGEVLIGWDERGTLEDVSRISEALDYLLAWTLPDRVKSG